MKNIIFIIYISISLAYSASAKNDGGGSSGGSSDSGSGGCSGRSGAVSYESHTRGTKCNM